MRKIFIILGILFPALVIQAEVDLSSFQSLYSENYEKISTLKESEVLSRMDIGFSDEIEAQIINQKIPQAFREKFPGYTRFKKEEDDFYAIYDFESSVLDFEENLISELEKLSIFSNEKSDDGLFDLIEDLNEIDVILFGEKASKTNPAFAKAASQTFNASAEDWQVGDEAKKNESEGLVVDVKMENNVGSAYSAKDSSISSNLESIKNDLVKLISKSLAPECTSKKHFEPTSLEKNLANHGSGGSFNASKPPKSKNEPESQENEKEVIAETFLGSETELIREVPCEERQKKILKGVSVEIVKESLNECRVLAVQNFSRMLEGIYKRTESISEKKHGYRIAEALDFWIKHFDTFLIEVVDMRKLLEVIADKTQKY